MPISAETLRGCGEKPPKSHFVSLSNAKMRVNKNDKKDRVNYSETQRMKLCTYKMKKSPYYWLFAQ